jgi:hypothetical protein
MVKNTKTHHFDIQIIHTQYKLKLFGDRADVYTKKFLSMYLHSSFCLKFKMYLNVQFWGLGTNLYSNISMYKYPI